MRRFSVVAMVFVMALLWASSALADTRLSGVGCSTPHADDHVLDFDDHERIEVLEYNVDLVCDLPAASPGNIYYTRVIVEPGSSSSTISCSMTIVSTFDGSMYATQGYADTSAAGQTDWLYVYPPSSYPGTALAAYLVCNTDVPKDGIKAIWVNE